MNTERKKNLLNIILEIILIILVIITINIIRENNSSIYIIHENSAIEIIGDHGGPTSIFVSREFNLPNFLKNMIFTVIIISLFILFIIDVIGFIKSKKYSIKYKLKIVLCIDIYLIIIKSIYFTFPIIGLTFIAISVLFNIVLLTFIFIKEILLKVIKYENKEAK
ncbi:MAG: hypothetical protein LBI28_01655 [Treponema sp.]|jgi:hypothetical protein|nr:hypothetical protein [Treponema sp.]